MVQSVRLTNVMREAIATKVIKYKYENNALAPELVKEAASIATAAYNSVFDEATRQKINDLPNGWLPEDDEIKVQFGYEYSNMNFNGSVTNVIKYRYRQDGPRIHNVIKSLSGGDVVKKRIPDNRLHAVFAQFNHKDELTTRFNSLKNRVEDLQKNFDDDVRSIRSTLSSFTTAKKLMEDWKEISPFVKSVIGHTDKPVVTALAIPVGDLNARFGLPVPA